MKMFTTLKNAMLVAALFVAGSALAQVTLVDNTTFNGSLNPFTAKSVSGSAEWISSSYKGVPFAKMTGYKDGSNEDWLISPSMDLSTISAAELTFDHAANYGTAANYNKDFTLWFSTNYKDGDDVNSATWQKVIISTYPGTGFKFVSASVNFPAFVMNQGNVHFAFKYVCGDANQPTWEITNLKAVEIIAPTLKFTNSIYFKGQVINTASQAQTLMVSGVNLTETPTYKVTGADAAAFQVTGSLTTTGGNLSVNFTPIKEGKNQATLTITSGNTSVDYKFSFIGLPTTTILWNEFGSEIAPFTTFDNTGDRNWYVTNHYAKMSGFSGGSANVNEDWLVSSALNLTGKEKATLSFNHACNHAGDMTTEMTLWYSTTYNDGAAFNNTDWKQIVITTYPVSDGKYIFVNNTVPLPADAQNAANVHFAFKYMSTADNAATWEIDNVLVTADNTQGVDDTLMDAAKVYTENNTIVVEGAKTSVKVYNVAGQVVASAPAAATVRVNANNGKGLYIVAVGNKAFKVVIK